MPLGRLRRRCELEPEKIWDGQTCSLKVNLRGRLIRPRGPDLSVTHSYWSDASLGSPGMRPVYNRFARWRR